MPVEPPIVQININEDGYNGNTYSKDTVTTNLIEEKTDILVLNDSSDVLINNQYASHELEFILGTNLTNGHLESSEDPSYGVYNNLPFSNDQPAALDQSDSQSYRDQDDLSNQEEEPFIVSNSFIPMSFTTTTDLDGLDMACRLASRLDLLIEQDRTDRPTPVCEINVRSGEIEFKKR